MACVVAVAVVSSPSSPLVTVASTPLSYSHPHPRRVLAEDVVASPSSTRRRRPLVTVASLLRREVRVERATELANGCRGQGACIGIVPSSSLALLSPRHVVRMRSRTCRRVVDGDGSSMTLRRRHVPLVLVVGAVAHALSSCPPRCASWSSWHLRHAILVELWSSRPPRCMSCRSMGTWTRISSLIAGGRRGDAWCVERAQRLVDCTGGYGGGRW